VPQAQITIVIPTLGRAARLRRVLDHLERQTVPMEAFEVVVVADAKETALAELDAIVDSRRYAASRHQATKPGASAARNVGWRAARAPLVLFVDDDILPEPPLVAEHLEWHDRHPEETVGVLGHVRWADELRVTPFMRWLEHGIQFDYPNIQGTDAGWARFYTANASVKKTMLERVGGFEEEALPFGYEDLDLALRMHAHGFGLLYNRAAVAEHVHPMDLEFWKRRVRRIAVAERQFVAIHPDLRPYFYELFSSAADATPARGLGARLAGFVPRSLPVLGPRVWSSADAVYRQALAEPFLDSWRTAETQEATG
jgi:glycosyltransferase involved in cell wall biosynthesis